MLPPSPYHKLAGCVWLPRIVGKSRLLAKGQLTDEFAFPFCHPGAVDGQFLAYFQLSREQIIATGTMNDEEVNAWFLSLPSVTPESIAAWNELAVNLGRPGYPMEETKARGMATSYKHLADRNFETIFGEILHFQ